MYSSQNLACLRTQEEDTLSATTLGRGDWRRVKNVVELCPPRFMPEAQAPLPWHRHSLLNGGTLRALETEYNALNRDQVCC